MKKLLTQAGIELVCLCRELDGITYAEEVLVTKSELEEKKQRMSELETQASLSATLLLHSQQIIRTECCRLLC